MASEVDICNLALARLGDNATVASIDPPEGSAQAEHCARFYAIARDSLLEMHPWKFATRRALLAQLSVESWNWAYAYAEPNGALKLLAVLPPTAANDDDSQPFEAQSDANGAALILTDQEDASLRFTTRVTDTTKFSPLFVDALAWLLASELAGPVVKGDTGAAMAKSCYQSFAIALSHAKLSDANQRKIQPTHNPAWIAGR
ncbi:MAG: hypothetical protein DWQ11_18810 [Proteobacteria bacterium]|nr:MAG: hypothetical protein DWQ11_18810 [Pseudomonadota bacterium]